MVQEGDSGFAAADTTFLQGMPGAVMHMTWLRARKPHAAFDAENGKVNHVTRSLQSEVG